MLAESTHGVIGATESICHVAAGMILCTLDCSQVSTRSSHWLWYVCGSKSIIKAAGLDEMVQDTDLTVLIGWVHYCDVLTRFSLRHWQPNLKINDGGISSIKFEPFHPRVCLNKLVSARRP